MRQRIDRSEERNVHHDVRSARRLCVLALIVAFGSHVAQAQIERGKLVDAFSNVTSFHKALHTAGGVGNIHARLNIESRVHVLAGIENGQRVVFVRVLMGGGASPGGLVAHERKFETLEAKLGCDHNDSDEWLGPFQDNVVFKAFLSTCGTAPYVEAGKQLGRRFCSPTRDRPDVDWRLVEWAPATILEVGQTSKTTGWSVSGGISVGLKKGGPEFSPSVTFSYGESSTTTWTVSETRIRSGREHHRGVEGVVSWEYHKFNDTDTWWSLPIGRINGIVQTPAKEDWEEAIEGDAVALEEWRPWARGTQNLTADFLFKLKPAPKVGRVWVITAGQQRLAFVEADAEDSAGWIAGEARAGIPIAWKFYDKNEQTRREQPIGRSGQDDLTSYEYQYGELVLGDSSQVERFNRAINFTHWED